MGVDHDVIQGTAFQAYNYISTIDDFFRVHIASSKHEGELGEFETVTVMQTRDAVEGLHNCREFSQHPECSGEAT